MGAEYCLKFAQPRRQNVQNSSFLTDDNLYKLQESKYGSKY